MGIDINSKLIVGLQFNELKDWLEVYVDEQGYDDEFDAIEYIFEYASPYYDSGMEDWVIGYEVNNNLNEFDSLQEIKELFQKFHQLTGLEARLINSPDVY